VSLKEQNRDFRQVFSWVHDAAFNVWKRAVRRTSDVVCADSTECAGRELHERVILARCRAHEKQNQNDRRNSSLGRDVPY
jgi:hypothetical protein